MTPTTTERGRAVLPLIADGDADWLTRLTAVGGGLLGLVGALFVLLNKLSEWRKKWQTDGDDVVFARDGRVAPVLQQQLADTRTELRTTQAKVETLQDRLSECLESHARQEEINHYNERVQQAQEDTIKRMLEQQRESGGMTDTAVHRALKPIREANAEPPPPPVTSPSKTRLPAVAPPAEPDDPPAQRTPPPEVHMEPDTDDYPGGE